MPPDQWTCGANRAGRVTVSARAEGFTPVSATRTVAALNECDVLAQEVTLELTPENG